MQTHITGVAKRENQCLCYRCFQKVFLAPEFTIAAEVPACMPFAPDTHRALRVEGKLGFAPASFRG